MTWIDVLGISLIVLTIVAMLILVYQIGIAGIFRKINEFIDYLARGLAFGFHHARKIRVQQKIRQLESELYGGTFSSGDSNISGDTGFTCGHPSEYRTNYSSLHFRCKKCGTEVRTRLAPR